MNFLYITLGIVCIVLGIGLILLYNYLVKANRHGGLSFKLRTGGIGLIIIGVVLIVKVCLSEK